MAIDRDKCVRCGFCSNVCRPETIIARSIGFDVFVGGNGGVRPREAALHCTVSSEEEVIEVIRDILERYSETAMDGERLGDLVERAGLGA